MGPQFRPTAPDIEGAVPPACLFPTASANSSSAANVSSSRGEGAGGLIEASSRCRCSLVAIARSIVGSKPVWDQRGPDRLRASVAGSTMSLDRDPLSTVLARRRVSSAQLGLGGASGAHHPNAPPSRTGTDLPAGRDLGTTESSGGVIGSTALAALYLRVADTLERSAELAEQHAQRCRRDGQRQPAAIEFERARRAGIAAERGRVLAERLRPRGARGRGETAPKGLLVILRWSADVGRTNDLITT